MGRAGQEGKGYRSRGGIKEGWIAQAEQTGSSEGELRLACRKEKQEKGIRI